MSQEFIINLSKPSITAERRFAKTPKVRTVRCYAFRFPSSGTKINKANKMPMSWGRKGFRPSKWASKGKARMSSAISRRQREREALLELKRAKSVVNIEKKYDTKYSGSTLNVGQVNGNDSGHLIFDITPTPLEGAAFNERIGQKIAVTGLVFDFQVVQMAAMVTGPAHIHVDIFQKVGDASLTIANFIDDIYDTNVFIDQQNAGTNSIYDAYSERNMDYFRTYRKVRSCKIRVNPDSLSAGQNLIASKKLLVKFFKPHVVKYNSLGTVTEGQLIMVVRSDIGNSSTTTACTLNGVSATPINTGYTFRYNIREFYTDL